MEETVLQVVETIDTTALEELLVVNNDLLARLYATDLFVIGVCGTLGVLFLLYKFIKLFY